MGDQRICATCRYNEGFTSPPLPGGLYDGVECSNPEVVKRDGNPGDITVNLWRVEVVVRTEEPMCEHWKKVIGKCPVCGGGIDHLDVLTLTRQYSAMRLGTGGSYDEELGVMYVAHDEDERNHVFTCPTCAREVAHDDGDAARILRGRG